MKTYLKKNNNISVNVNDTLGVVIKKINTNNINGVFVIDKNSNLKGIITDADIRKSLLNESFNKKAKVKSVMKKNFYYLNFNKLENSYNQFIKSHKILIPILKNKKLYDYIHISNIQTNTSKKNNDRILITGGLGYIGSVLTEKLIKKGYKVNILDANLYGNYLNKKKYGKNLKVFVGNCFSKSNLSKAINNCRHVIHLGEIVGDLATVLNMNFSIKNNFETTNFLVNECLKRGIERFIFTSSCSVYGFSKQKCNERSKLNPISLYARCKVACEKQILSFKAKIFTPTILRLSTVHGISPRLRLDLVVNRFCANAVLNNKISVYGEKNWRPLISVQDVADGIILAFLSDKHKINRKIFNLGSSNENYTIRNIVEKIAKKTKSKVEYKLQTEDPRSYRVSFTKIEKVLKFRPKNPLKKSINSIIKSYKKNRYKLNNINFYNDKKINKLQRKKYA
jgi:nucleoside-diphosphate-sugar epimerase|tara:strand:- start:2276 stop:3634 length:1359 start_codon:yes stop_codon:yes gene_type:complete